MLERVQKRMSTDLFVRGLRNLFVSEKMYFVALALISAALFAFLSINRAINSMWVEGMPEYQHVLLATLGFIPVTPGCWINFHSIHIPLALNQYIGPAFFYFHLPTAYLWFNGYTSDPYIYRYVGTFLLLIDGWILFYTLRIYYKVSISFYGATAFLIGTFLACLGEAGYHLIMLFFIFITVFFFSRFLKTGKALYLLASALTYGMTLTTRIELFVWSFVAFSMYFVIARPPIILDRLKRANHKALLSFAILSSFCLGAAPTIIYNLTCPDGGLLSFFNTTVLPNTLGAASTPLADKLQTRLAQFWDTILLGGELPNANPASYILAGLWILCAAALVVRWITQRKASLFLIVILTSIPLSVFVSRGLRAGHLIIIQPAVLMVIVSGLVYLEEFPRFRKLTYVGFALLILGNTYSSAVAWHSLKSQPDTVQTMSNQSDPVLLASYLIQHHSKDRVLYTNVGMVNYMSYMTAGRFAGEEIFGWNGDEQFANNVRIALLDSEHRRVFVAVGKERDGGPGTARRTGHLYSILDKYSIPYSVEKLSSERNRFLYEFITVEKGVSLKAETMKAGTLRVSDVVDVRVEPQPDGSAPLVGSILGAGFKPGYVVLINGKSTFQTIFGNDGWITFSFPIQTIEGEESFTLEVFDPQTLERSNLQKVFVKR